MKILKREIIVWIVCIVMAIVMLLNFIPVIRHVTKSFDGVSVDANGAETLVYVTADVKLKTYLWKDDVLEGAFSVKESSDFETQVVLEKGLHTMTFAGETDILYSAGFYYNKAENCMNPISVFYTKDFSNIVIQMNSKTACKYYAVSEAGTDSERLEDMKEKFIYHNLNW